MKTTEISKNSITQLPPSLGVKPLRKTKSMRPLKSIVRSQSFRPSKLKVITLKKKS